VLDESKLQSAIAEVSESMPALVMRRIVEQVLELIAGADGAVVELADRDALAYVCAAGTLAEHVGLRLPYEQSLSGLAVKTGETLYCRDAKSDDRVAREACLRVGAASMVCVPLRRNGAPVGALKVSAARPHAFGPDDVAVLTKLARFITVAISAAADIAEITRELLAGCPPPDPGGQAANALGADRLAGVSRHPGMVSEFVANVLRPGIVADVASRQRIEAILAHREIRFLCQPIVELDSGTLVAAEALARFREPPQRPPNAWFAQAQQLGFGVRMQLLALRLAVELLQVLPEHVCLCVNAGPEAILAPELPALLAAAGADRIVLELTEHLAIDDYPRLMQALSWLRDHRSRLAVDDTGAGFASMTHIVKLAPELIKLDREFTRGIDIDPVRRSVAGAFVTLAGETGAQVIAEGIETADELETVRRLGIRYGQGYFIARPGPVDSLLDTYVHVAPDRRAAGRREATSSRLLRSAR
jgi:EAL domain-containing protein (putative c-di-GMP-specific phosphodiesterase class I)